jgi:hypothetical protein
MIQFAGIVAMIATENRTILLGAVALCVAVVVAYLVFQRARR